MLASLASLKRGCRCTQVAGADGRLFGTVKAEAIAEAIEAAGIGSVDKRTIHLGSAIKRTGEYKVTVRLHADVVANVVLDVVAAA